MQGLEDIIVDAFIRKQFKFYLDRNQPLEAVNFIWPILLKDRNNRDLNTLLGIAYCHSAEKGKKSDTENAKLYLNKALEIDSDAFLPRYYLARTFIAEDNYQSALDELNELKNRGHEKEQVYQGISALKKALQE